MKTSKVLTKYFRFCSGMALAATLIAWLPNSIQAQEKMKPMKGAEMLMMKEINTPAQAEELKPGDSLAMACTKCKSIMTHNVATEKGHIKVMTVGEKHLCPGCNSTITVVGTGKGKHDIVKHVCGQCGDDSIFCCATKPGAGKTKGCRNISTMIAALVMSSVCGAAVSSIELCSAAARTWISGSDPSGHNYGDRAPFSRQPRRAEVDGVNGFAGDGVTEDVEVVAVVKLVHRRATFSKATDLGEYEFAGRGGES